VFIDQSANKNTISWEQSRGVRVHFFHSTQLVSPPREYVLCNPQAWRCNRMNVTVQGVYFAIKQFTI